MQQGRSVKWRFIYAKWRVIAAENRYNAFESVRREVILF